MKENKKKEPISSSGVKAIRIFGCGRFCSWRTRIVSKISAIPALSSAPVNKIFHVNFHCNSTKKEQTNPKVFFHQK